MVAIAYEDLVIGPDGWRGLYITRPEVPRWKLSQDLW